MKPLQQMTVPAQEAELIYRDLIRKWIEGNQGVRDCFPATSLEEVRTKIHAYVQDEVYNQLVFANDVYQVAVRVRGDWRHLSIKRLDRETIHDWRDLQEIKNQILGPEAEAVELFPAESRLVDSANQYHLWAPVEPEYKFPFGFTTRMVGTEPIGKSVNRPFEKEPYAEEKSSG